MKKQIVVIHGADSFPKYGDYIKFLKDFEMNLQYLNKKDWKSLLSEELGEEYEVIQPRMPNKSNAKYIEWKIWFEKLFPFLRNDVILIGHSIGGSFLVKYLSENKFPKKIKGTFLVSAPYDEDEGRPLVEFVLPESLKKLEEQGGKIFLYHSEDDPVVDFNELSKYQKSLPNAKLRVFENREHFGSEEFPEILGDIKNLG